MPTDTLTDIIPIKVELEWRKNELSIIFRLHKKGNDDPVFREFADAFALDPLYDAARGCEDEGIRLELGRAWAKLSKEVNGYRYITGNVIAEFERTLIKEGLILQAETDADYLRLLIREGAPPYVLQKAVEEQEEETPPARKRGKNK